MRQFYGPSKLPHLVLGVCLCIGCRHIGEDVNPQSRLCEACHNRLTHLANDGELGYVELYDQLNVDIDLANVAANVTARKKLGAKKAELDKCARLLLCWKVITQSR